MRVDEIHTTNGSNRHYMSFTAGYNIKVVSLEIAARIKERKEKKIKIKLQSMNKA